MLLRSCGAALAAWLVVACTSSSDGHVTQADTNDGGGDANACAPYFGDSSAAAELEITGLSDYSHEVSLIDGGDVTMLFPPQGGRVVFVGIRARNVDGCGLQLTGSIRDSHTHQIRLDGRTVVLRDAGGGWGESGGIDDGGTANISSYANIPVCPNQWASSDLFDQSFELEVSIQDRRGKTANKVISVVPRCAGDAQGHCRCICAHGYVLGQSCDADAATGTGDASAD